MIANILTIAGSDPSGGAGIQADIKAISACGGYAMAVVTALTAQNTCGVQGVQMVSPDFVAAQIKAIRDDIRIDAIKIGMLGTAPIIEAVAHALAGLTVPIVVDTVMVAKGGSRLLEPAAVRALSALIATATVITPNLPEAADLLSQPMATSRAAMETQARALLALGPAAVLLKGGHLLGDESPDLLAQPEDFHWLSGPRVRTQKTHGTGCTLSSALATELGRGLGLEQATANAKQYVAQAIAAADALEVGHGHGPTHHFFGWPPAP